MVADDKSIGPVEFTNIAGIINKDRYPPIYNFIDNILSFFRPSNSIDSSSNDIDGTQPPRYFTL